MGWPGGGSFRRLVNVHPAWVAPRASLAARGGVASARCSKTNAGVRGLSASEPSSWTSPRPTRRA